MGTGVGLYTMVAGLFVLPLQDGLGWSRGEIAAAGAFAVLSALIFPALGAAIDRYGGRRIAAAGMVLLAGSYVALAGMPQKLWVYYLVATLLACSGTATTPIVFTHVVNGWFSRARGLALGVTLTGVTATSVIALPLLAWVIQRWGWRTGFICLAAFPLLLGLPFVLAFLRDRGLEAAPTDEVVPAPRRNGLRMGRVLRDRRFWLLAAAMLLANLPIGGFLSQLQPLLLDRQFEAATAAGIGSLFAAAIAIGRLGSGCLVDRLWAPGVAASFISIPVLGALILLVFEQPSVVLAAAAAVLLGLAQGAEADFLAYLVPKYFGLSSYGAIFGSLLMVVSFALASGAILFGVTYDRFGDYQPAVAGSLGAYLVAAACILASGIPRSTSELSAT